MFPINRQLFRLTGSYPGDFSLCVQTPYPTEDEFFLQLKTRGPTVEENILEQETKTQLLHYCRLLKEPYREIAILYFYDELGFEEIARKTGKNIKTVQTQVYRSKAMLKKFYQKEGYGHGKKAATTG